MTEEFEVLHDRPRIVVTLTRDSVCAGDDCQAPHEKQVEVHSFLDPHAFASQFWTGYLPGISGVGHSWTAYLNGRAIALFTVTKIEPMVSTINFEAENAIHFEYHSATY